MSLKIGPGIDSIPTDTIPDDPAQFIAWFKGVGMKRWFANADVRNAIQGTGITITGNSGTPATISGIIGKIPSHTVLGNVTASTANPVAITQAQLTALVNLATASLSGAMPVLSGNAQQFLDGIGGWAALVNSITGTANQVIASASTGTVTLSLPQSINSGAAPTFAGTNFTGIPNAAFTNSQVTVTAGTNLSGGGSVALGASITLNCTLAGANPSGAVGLSAANGTATTFMRSDAAPALSVSISPTWTGNHTHSPSAGVALALNGVAGSSVLTVAGASNAAATATFGGTTGQYIQITDGTINAIVQAGTGISSSKFGSLTNHNCVIIANNVVVGTFAVGGAVTLVGPLGWNGATPPAQVTGFGTPVGAAVVASYNSGTSTALQDKQTIAEILTIMKAHGMIGA